MTEIIDLRIERPVAGGRMLARVDGRVVLVAGAIPGERVRAKVERKARNTLWATVVDLVEPSPDRRVVRGNPACGGQAFAHVAYPRQLDLKAEILRDAFHRQARLTLPEPPTVAASPESGYRMRSRLHVVQGRVGFFLEGSHTLCDARETQQVQNETLDAAEAVVAALGPGRDQCEAVVVAENAAGTERVVHLEPHERARLDGVQADLSGGRLSVTGVTTMVRQRLATLSGSPFVTDTARGLNASGIADEVTWRRRPTSFFQGNRYLTGRLVASVVGQAEGESCVDLYAGVGLFAAALAARGERVLAAESDGSAFTDLEDNLRPWSSRVALHRGTVESAPRPRFVPDVVVTDPPRTGMSAEAIRRLVEWRPRRCVYVSCDPPTLARDAAVLFKHGYRLISLSGFDLFPNTPHVEAVAVFDGPAGP